MKILPLLLLTLLAGCSSPETAPRSAAPEAPAPRITQFYAATAAVPKGESTNLCYGVEGAAAVRIDPPVEQLKPTLARCISVSPVETTTYTLTVTGEQGKTATQSATITIAGARPKFNDISISSKEVKPGEQVQFCFKASNAISVSGAPGHFLRGGSPKADCLIDNPRQTTSYKLTISGGAGLTDEASITVQVR